MKPQSIPRLNVPYDVGAASLFDTTYVHPLLRDSPFPWAYYDIFAKWTVALVSGTKAGLDQWVGGISPERYHVSKSKHSSVTSSALTNSRQVFLNKSTNAMPYISEQYRTSTLLNKIRSRIVQVPLVDTHGRKIDLAPRPKEIDEKGVVIFTENGRPEAEVMKEKVCKPDVLILATGYTQDFSFLDNTYPTPQDATVRNVWKENDETVGFVGFIRPSFGKWFLATLLCSRLMLSRSYSSPCRDAGATLGVELASALACSPEIRGSLPPSSPTHQSHSIRCRS